MTTRRHRVLEQRRAKRAGQKWDVTYRTASGGTFTVLLPGHYGSTPADVRRYAASSSGKRQTGRQRGMDDRSSERLRVVSVKRSDRY